MDVSKDSYVPNCDNSMKPYVGMMFSTLRDGIDFYDSYARASGFDTRLSTLRKSGDIIIWRYIVCSREGEKYHEKVDNQNHALVQYRQKRRKRLSMRCGCMAKIVLKYQNVDSYLVNMFVENHSHPLVEAQYQNFMKLNRQIDTVHQKFILDCARTNIGPTQSARLLKEFLGGCDGVCSVVDVRNYSRDMRAFVDGADAQMLLNEMERKQQMCSTFSYHYDLDQEGKLMRLFWSDSISKKNYKVFGDVVAFDTTYSTNKYCLIFAPFTGKDNHGKPVTFAVGLLSKEDSESFSWLFERFLDCMSSAPRMIITDQDLGMKVAIQRVFLHTRHRWCMWHIMLKIADKVSKDLHSNENFKNDLLSYVWSELIEPDYFEEGWYHIMVNYGLVDNKWFDTMFELREYWVPAFFRDFPMSGLMKTTSISECENSFYERYTRSHSNLLQFLINYNRAIEAQRDSNSYLNYLDSSCIPKMETTLLIEKHVSMIYTSKILKAIQVELLAACFSIQIFGVDLMGEVEVYNFEDESDGIFVVDYNRNDESASCSCKLFTRMGILCRHIFFVLKNKGIKNIPDNYVISRWKKFSLLDSLHEVQLDSSDVNLVENKKIEKKILSAVVNCVGKIGADSERLNAFLSGINELEQSILNGTEMASSDDLKKKLLEDYYGASVPESIEVLPPNVVKTKGSGSRIISRKEKAARDLKKPSRMCKKCKQMANHDSMNCDKVNK